MSGIDLYSAGEYAGGEGTRSILLRDPVGGVYRKLVLRADRLVGACLYGDSSDSGWYQRLIREGASITGFRDRLMFGEALAHREIHHVE